MLERLSSRPDTHIQWLVMIGGIVVACLIGYQIGVDDRSWLVLLGAVVFTLLIVVGLGRRAWVLILAAWSITGSSALWSLPLAVRDIGIILAAGAYVGYRVISHNNLRQPMHALDWVLVLNLAYVFLTFLINPIGLRVFGAEMVGARTYVNIALAATAYWLIVRLPTTTRSAIRAPFLIVAGGMVISLLFLSSYALPWLPQRLPYLYALFDVGTFFSGAASEEAVPRYKRMVDGCLPLVIILCAYCPPRRLLNPLRLPLYTLALAITGVLAAGFRSVLLWVLVSLVLGAWFYRQWREVLVAMVVFFLLMGVIAFGQGRLFELPLPAQRALAFIPGRWAASVEEDVNTTNKVRFQWWRDILEQGMIKNWWVGDGFGANINDMQSAQQFGSNLESMSVVGSFHSGPLTTIRYAGIWGLLLLYVLMISSAVWAVRYVGLCRDGPLMPLTIYLAIQLVWIPIHFTLIFGSYNVDLPQQIFLCGLVRLVIRFSAESSPAPVPALQPALSSRHGYPRRG